MSESIATVANSPETVMSDLQLAEQARVIEARKELDTIIAVSHGLCTRIGDNKWELGRLWAEYVSKRLALGDDREASIKTLEATFGVYFRRALAVSDWIAAAFARDLLHAPFEKEILSSIRPMKPDRIEPLSHYHYLVLRKFLERADKGRCEKWAFLEGAEERARSVFARVRADGLSGKSTLELVDAELVKHFAERAKTKTNEVAEMKLVAMEAQQELDRLRGVKAELDKRALAASVEGKPEIAPTQEELAKAQAELVQFEADVAELAKEMGRTGHAAKVAEKRAKGGRKPKREPSETVEEGPNPNPIEAWKKAGYKDRGQMCANILADGEEPVGALAECLLEFRKMIRSKRVKRAVDAAILQLSRREDEPSPATAVSRPSVEQQMERIAQEEAELANV